MMDEKLQIETFNIEIFDQAEHIFALVCWL